jgi:hypothetical protein
VDLGPPEAIVAVDTVESDLRRGNETSRDEDGVLIQTSQPDYLGGRRTIVPLGIDVQEHACARWRIRVDDPRSGEVENSCSVTLTRDDWCIHIEAEATLRCTADQFIATSVMRAFEGKSLVRERHYERSSPRIGA